MLKVGITGHIGFIGSHLKDRLAREKEISVIPLDDELFLDPAKLKKAISECSCIAHLAGMNRGQDEEIFKTNLRLTQTLIQACEELKIRPHIVFSSSIQSSLDNAFGRSKRESCERLESWSKRTHGPVTLLTIPNVFGDRGKPFYNSVAATFCYQLTHEQEPKIETDRELELIYINDLIEIIWRAIAHPPAATDAVRVKGTKHIKVSQLLEILKDYRAKYLGARIIPPLADPFLRDLFNMFLSYIDPDRLKYSPQVHSDQRGSLFEIVKMVQGGQIFFSGTEPGQVRGNHYHTRKIERFCVIEGEAKIRLRRIGGQATIEYEVSGKNPTFIEIPIFHTHQIINSGPQKLLTLFWANELFDPNDPDTFPEEV